jgi:hypothetical protein
MQKTWQKLHSTWTMFTLTSRANIPVFGSCCPHVWKLTCPRLPTNISMFFTTSCSFWCSSTFLFPKCWCPTKRLRFLVTSQKHGFLIVTYNILLSNFDMPESYNVTFPTEPNTNLFIAHDDLAQRELLNVIYLRKLLDVLCLFQYSHTWTSPKK